MTIPAIYLEREAQALAAYNKALAVIGQRKQSLVHDYGFAPSQDKSNLGKYIVDTHNPYGLLQLMKRSQGQSLMDAYNAAQERGLGHSGLANQAEDNLKFTQGAESANLGKQFTSNLQGLSDEGSSALQAYNDAKFAAEADARNEMLAQLASTQYGTGASDIPGAASTSQQHSSSLPTGFQGYWTTKGFVPNPKFVPAPSLKPGPLIAM